MKTLFLEFTDKARTWTVYGAFAVCGIASVALDFVGAFASRLSDLLAWAAFAVVFLWVGRKQPNRQDRRLRELAVRLSQEMEGATPAMGRGRKAVRTVTVPSDLIDELREAVG